MTEIHEQNNGSFEVIKISKLGFVCCKQLASCFFTIIQRTRFISQKDTYTQLLVIFSTVKEWVQPVPVQKNIKLGFSCCKQLASCFFSIIQSTQFLSQKDTYTTACHFLDRERMDSILPCPEAYNWRRFLHHA